MRRFILTILFAVMLLPLQANLSCAQSIIRDAEIEHSLKVMSEPILLQAGITPNQVQFVIIQDSTVNAFVAAGQNIFINTGLIMKTENVDELLGVIAHETGHIAGGHLIRIRQAIEDASIQTILTTIFAAAVAVGGGGEAAGGVMAGGAEIGRRQVLKNSRAFESSADQAALTYLENAQYSADGLASFLEKLSRQELLPENQQSEYIRTHPLTYERVQTVEAAAKKSQYYETPFPEKHQEAYRRIRAKITGYLEPDHALREYSDPSKTVDLYARAIAMYRRDIIQESLNMIEELISREPENPYFYELKGQILFEEGQTEPAVEAYKEAAERAPDDASLIKMAYAHALLELNNNEATQTALAQLLQSERYEKKTPRMHRLIATAYGRIGEQGLATLHLAEEGYLKNDLGFAARQTRVAMEELEKGSTAYQRAQDLLAQIERRRNDD